VRHGIERTRRGEYRVRLDEAERELLRSLPAEVRDVLAADDPSTVRLFPPAFGDDSLADDEYRRLTRGELRDGKLAALRTLEETAHAERLDDEQLGAWLGALESIRLVLGTQLDVTEETYETPLDPLDPKTPTLALYAWLSWLQEQVVYALSRSLGDA
jgi:Domain of unknown function (DUF2017)